MKDFIRKLLREDLGYNHVVGSAIHGKYQLTENSGDYGYHAGNLKHKSGVLSRNNFAKTLKSQLGTGLFFFGDINDAETLAGVKKGDKNRADMLKGTKVYKVDFSKYNLLKPNDATEFYDGLIIPMVKYLNFLTPSDIINDEESLMQGVDGNSKKNDIYIALIELSDYYRYFGVNITDNDFIKIVYQYLVDIESKSSKTDDVINTRILKHLRFDGVDLRNSEKDGLVNGKANVGSVIFDVKPGTISDA
jgi:hypothetical protein